jgi:putative phosphoribosyl transferase
MFFNDRTEAGHRLAERLAHLRGRDVVVVGLPRGGIPVAFEVAKALGAPLDVIIVRKLGVPFQPELAMGAVGEGGVRVVNHGVVQLTGVTPSEFAAVEMRERREVEHRAHQFRGTRPQASLAGRTVVIVDDGIATGSTARAACQVARAAGADRVVLAVPVAPPGWTTSLEQDADELIALDTPRNFYAIGQWYVDFSQTRDDQVRACLDRAGATPPAAPDRPTAAATATSPRR